ncbi:AAA family ATPase [Schlesneria sp. T3-172]|uniref:AAA family ATPase n=1 Tax=Schlesneria sphaerica TaxID=3373610 RepID=UPI0037C763DC
MAFSLSIPRGEPNGALNLTVAVGEMLFILGANGTGKSSLMQGFSSASPENTRRIAAHRQTWFRSGSPEFTGQQRQDYERSVVSYDRHANARWMDDYAPQRAQMAIYDLVNSENVRARDITRAVDEGRKEDVANLAEREGAFKVMNRMLRLANLGIALSVEANDQIMAVRSNSKPYSIAKLSDGERNAILIAANVLTIPPGTLLLIDEPERHLHRSIVSPLLSLLLKERQDCAFVVSTHEPLLPVDNPKSRVLLTRGCVYEGDSATSYDIDLLDSTDAIDDDLKRTILGERRKIVFVEGVEHSLDKPLYSLLFPNASIVAKASCRDVENAVVGIKGTSELHWVKPFGLVDNDSSEPERIADLQAKGVIPLNVYSVESIYFHPDVQRLVAEKHATVIGGDVIEKLRHANDAAMQAIRQNAGHLSNRIAEKAARAQVFSLLPKKGEIGAGRERTVVLDFQKIAEEEATRLQTLIDASDFVGVLKRYPIRESPAIDAIVRTLSFANRAQYEAAVRKLLADNQEAVLRVHKLLGELPPDLIAT